MRVLAVNAGSSTLKLTLLGSDDATLDAIELPAQSSSIDPSELRRAIDRRFSAADAVGHRIVHGGERFHSAVLVDDARERELRELGDLAPLHQAKSLAALEAVSDVLPHVPAVACFDTAFHAGLAPAARTYALPARWRERWPLRRFGFHGLSHAWVARRAAALLEREGAAPRIVSAHLGAGASLCAIEGGRSVDTTMGFTPLEGLVMATRSGSVDPGLLVWVLEQGGMDARELGDALEHEAGLTGLAGTGDMREALARAAAGDADAELAIDVYCHRLRAGIAAMAASMDGLDALVFTGGVGENAPSIRERALAGLSFLGVAIDATANAASGGDRRIGAGGADAETLVVHAREDLEMARQVRSVLGRS